ncbi:phosphotransferase [Paenibacillus prosopidis]|uniref:Homoserine kinase type II n=1 Tax=Paenibacillus prosopidis TaxID=630520 RepID=A0A368W907_9BACL|nr:phosphotransferase [Paenibacillus prosopidis]RCW50921.1 homoserine kinase type II [Paenibacillus prosopidis]
MNDTIDFTAFLEQYAFQAPCEVEHRESGMNNTTRMISSGMKRYVLRIYNNHKDANIVRLEHEVLAELQKQELPFQVPVPVRNKQGDTVCIANDGTLSALFHYIDGDRLSAANAAHISALGKTAALLTIALSEIEPIQKPLYSPYFSLEGTYMSMDGTTFLGMAERSPSLAARRSSLIELQEERQNLKGEYDAIARLPQQWIHGDLVFNNTVSQGEKIIGVLDFEFSTVDVRAMELAVIAVDLIKSDDPLCIANVKLLLEGYRQSFQLTEQELEKLPSLMKLRLLDVALHFASRFRDGLDGEDVLCGIIDQSAFGCKWLNEHWEDVKV